MAIDYTDSQRGRRSPAAPTSRAARIPSAAVKTRTWPPNPPNVVSTGFLQAMTEYDTRLRAHSDSMMALDGRLIDSRWPEVADALLTLHHWDPDAFDPEAVRSDVTVKKIHEWSRRGGGVPLEQIGWTFIEDIVRRLDALPWPGDRDWTIGTIELQHNDAIPVGWNHLDSITRIGTLATDARIDGPGIFIRMVDVFNAHLLDFARHNKNELEIVTTDIASAIASRHSWLPDWAFVWPTYFGRAGVYAYNLWVEQTPVVEYVIARAILEEAVSGR